MHGHLNVKYILVVFVQHILIAVSFTDII